MILTRPLSGLILLCCCNLIMLMACKKKSPTPVTPVTTVQDADGNVYNTVKIGSQTWMAENLRTTRYNDGTAISTGLDNATWSTTTTGAYASYDDNATMGREYGILYNWHAVNTGKLAPQGWRVPTKEDIAELVNYLGGSSVAGGKLKSTSSLWTAPNEGATNSSGFNALPSGYRSLTGGYSGLGGNAYFWSSAPRNTSQSEYLRLISSDQFSLGNAADNNFGYAVRCLKN